MCILRPTNLHIRIHWTGSETSLGILRLEYGTPQKFRDPEYLQEPMERVAYIVNSKSKSSLMRNT